MSTTGEILRWPDKKAPPAPQATSQRLLTRHARGEPCGEDALLLQGENLEILSHLLATGHKNTVDLVYLDPPFGSNARYTREIRLRGEPEHRLGKQEQYTDLLPRDDYLQFMYERLLMLANLLAPQGSLLLHADEHNGHLLRCLLDEIFGADAFVNEVIWHYPDNFQGNVRGLAHNHNAIHWYANGPRYTANTVRVPLPKPIKRDRRVWSKEESRIVAARDADGKLIYDTYTDRKADDVWSIGQSAVTKRRSGEYLGYPTQKPLALLERLLLATSNPGDLVLDPFAGSGTSAAAAQRLGRRWIACDRNPISIQTTAIRLRAEIERENPPHASAQTAFSVVAIGELASEETSEGVLQVETRTEGSTLEMQVVAFSTPNLQALLEGEMPEDWRRMVECIQVDPSFDGEVFRPTICDRPVRTRDLVQGTYRVAAGSSQVALRLTDVSGNELTWMLNA